MKSFAVALRVTLFTLLVTGVVYPIAVTGAARLLFPDAARGSLLSDEKGRIVGSDLIGQRWTSAGYLQGRPSAAGDAGYDAMASSGANLGPTSQKLRDRVAQELARLRRENPDAPDPIPQDLLTASASGLDPHVSPAAAGWQAPRIAKARNIAVERVRAVIESEIEGRDLGLLGEPRVNVLRVNLKLDRQFGALKP